MCVIAYKDKNARLPSEANIRAMWRMNPHGAGVMWRRADNRIGFRKGFMKLEEFLAWYGENAGNLNDAECAFHFRITTHGGTCPGNCHPFVVGKDSDPHALEGVADRILMHNGVLYIVPRRDDISDSAELAFRLADLADPVRAMTAVNEQFAENRIILMDADGTHFFGDRWKSSAAAENAGLLYSNLNFEPFALGDCVGRGGYVYAYEWDDKRNAFVDVITQKTVSAEEIDPEELSSEDYGIWCDMVDVEMADAAYRLGVSVAEYRDLEIEAESCGMSVDEYLDMLDEEAEDECSAGFALA